jgi:hypothetical protein
MAGTRSIPGRSRGGSKLRRRLGKTIRRILNREVLREEPQLNQPRKVRNFWWNFW